MQLLTRKEVATMLKVTVRKVDLMRNSKALPYIRLEGNSIRFKAEDITKYLNNRYHRVA